MTIRSESWASGLTAAVAVFAATAASSGLFWPAGAPSLAGFTSLHGEACQLLGYGLYRFNSRLLGAGFLGQDIVTLVLAVPAVVVAGWLAHRTAALPWLLVRAALLTYFLYVYATMALGAAYNELFLAYDAIFSASLFALVLALGELSARLASEWERIAPALPRRGLTVLLLVCGVFTGLIWAQPLVSALIAGTPPPLLGPATTAVTEAIDLAIIVPGTLVAAMLIWNRRPAGYVIAAPLLGLLVMLVPTIATATVSQIAAGVSFTVPEIVGPIAGFLIFGAAGALMLSRILRAVRIDGRTARPEAASIDPQRSAA